MLDHKPNPENIGKHAYGLIWSGDFMPMIGDVVTSALFGPSNDLVVVGYFTEDGYLGVEVKPIAPPKWWIKQNDGMKKNAFLFGIEIKKANL